MRIWVIAFGLALLGTPAVAQTPLTQPVSEQVATLGPVHLRLPAGQWQEVSQEDHGLTRVDGGGWSNTPRSSKMFVQTGSGHVAAILLLGANTASAREGWAPPPMCSRINTYWSDHRNGWTPNYDCALVNHSVMRQRADTGELMQAAFAAARSAGGMPKQMIRAEFADAEARNEIRVYVAFNPELAGLVPSGAGWKSSEWQASKADAAHRAYLDQVVAWASSYRTVVRSALP